MGYELRDCREHGAFRGDSCPVCGSQGKILMTEREVDSVSRMLAAILRHSPERYGIRLDEHGWARIYSIIPAIRAERRGYGWLTPRHIEALIATDEKKRYSLDGKGYIRANYGHTIPVELDDLPSDNIPDILYYQTSAEEYEIIKEAGISPSDKTWVHLSKTYRQAYVSGLFHIDDPKIVSVDAKGLLEVTPVYRATEDIFVVMEVPAQFVSESPEEDVTLTDEEKSEIQKVKERRERRANRSMGE
ncbi:MAG: RNA 2'-phosphotransferase [Candidatus Thermoplasmatota archaeon]|nr:RNA 2'-phosphotransferase [Candidatus Thermoplasmatota archaeon]MCL5665956.1 RNA 2'-phosphotransferase [Candidatus Thermoplasmatota archaeon]